MATHKQSQLTHDIFARHLTSHFQVEGAAVRSAAVELVEAREMHAPPGYEAFSIVFRGPSDAFLAQGIYRFHHGQIGAFDLFIVPIRQDQGGMYYEAIFNRREEQRYA